MLAKVDQQRTLELIKADGCSNVLEALQLAHLAILQPLLTSCDEQTSDSSWPSLDLTIGHVVESVCVRPGVPGSVAVDDAICGCLSDGVEGRAHVPTEVSEASVLLLPLTTEYGARKSLSLRKRRFDGRAVLVEYVDQAFFISARELVLFIAGGSKTCHTLPESP